MKNEEFDNIVDFRIDRILAILRIKAEEYARGDRLSNFKRAAAMLGSTPERALVGMMAKHWVSILDMVDDIEKDISHEPSVWNEKIGDSVNYLILLEALVIERAAIPPIAGLHQEKTKAKRR